MSDASPKTLLELRGVRETQQFPYDCGIAVDSFRLCAGEVAVVEIAREISHSPLADLVCGLNMADEGTVLFEGLDWSTASADDASRARSRIGRVFEATTIHWLSNLDLDENLTLAFRFHHGPVTAEVDERVERMARQAGCWPLPNTRPAITPKNQLRRAEWVRAFLANPALIVLERPLREISGDTSGLVSMADEALKRGATILLVTRDSDPWQSLVPKPASRWILRDGLLVEKN